MFKRMTVGLRITAFLLVLTLISVCLPAGNVSPVSASGITETFEDGGTGAFVCDKLGGVSNREAAGNHYMNISPDVDGLLANARYPVSFPENAEAEISFRFMLNNYVINGQTIANLSYKYISGVVLEIHNGTLSYKDAEGGYVRILDEVLANKWYKVCISVDYNAASFNVSVDEKERVYGAPVLGDVTTVDSISFTAKNAPGIRIDDFSVNCTNTAKQIVFTGDNEVELAYDTTGTQTISVEVIDNNGVKVENAVLNLTVSPAASGVTASQNGNTVTLQIAEDAPETEYTLRAVYQGAEDYFRFTLKRYTPEVSEITISGDARIAYTGEETRYIYKAVALDNKGNEIQGGSFNYYLSNEISAITLDEQTGELLVNAELPKDTPITLYAELSGKVGVVGTKRILLQDEENYQGDNARFQVLLDYVDRVREIGRDPWNGSPLIVSAIDRYTMKPAAWHADDKTYVPTNLAGQANWFRSMDGLYAITGDEQYKKEVTDTFQFYIDHFQHKNGMLPMGGHRYVDVRDLQVVGENIMELKAVFPYLKPYWDLDAEGARKMIISHFRGSFQSWGQFIINRHVDPYINFSTAEYDDWANKAKPLSKEQYGYRIVQTGKHGFRAAGTDVIYLLSNLYENTGEEPAFRWAYRLAQQYYAATDPETKIVPSSFTSRKGMSTNTETRDDRALRDIAPDAYEQGFITEWQRYNLCLDPFYISGPTSLNPSYSDINMAKKAGIDTPEGREILDFHLTSMASYAKLAYNEEEDTYSPILIDGTKLTGLVIKNPLASYYVKRGQVLEDARLAADYWLAMIRTFIECDEYYDVFGEQLDTIWGMIRNHASFNGMGEMGYTRPGEGTKANLSTTVKDPNYLLGLCMLYAETDEAQYLDLARRVANNIVKSNMVSGLFTHKPSSHYISLSGNAGDYVYAFMLLEAVLRGQMEDIPEYFPSSEPMDDEGYLEDTGEFKAEVTAANLWYRYSKMPVKITSIDLPQEEITMKVGEEKYLEIAIEPDDATSKSLNIVSSDPACVSLDYSDRCMYALKPGTAKIHIVVANKRWIKKTLTVNVTE